MSANRRRARTVLAALVAIFGAGGTAAQEPTWDFSGSAKSFLLASRTLPGEEYRLNLNRLRLEVKGDPAPGLAIDVQLDNELLLGSYLHTAAFQALKDTPAREYWRAEANTFERQDAYGRVHLYRATMTLSRGPVDVTVGRQRIAWGTGRFWSALDIFNPVNPLAIERDERLGVDAVLAELQTGPLSRVSVVVAPAPDDSPPGRALQWHGNTAGVDVSAVAEKVLGLDLIGFDAASQLGQAGVRGEVARLRGQGHDAFTRATLGADYAFENGLIASGELYYNGAGARDPNEYDLAGAIAGRVNQLATRYLGAYASYEITPLLKWTTYAVFNLDDSSRGVDSRLVWSWRPNVEWTLGLQRFAGAASSEFGRFPASFLVQWHWFF